jgi:hypothetical protein
MMDEHFSFFLENFGPATDRQEVPQSSLIRYKNRLPKQLLDYWQEHGWCGYAQGLLWTVNPREYENILSDLLAEGPFDQDEKCHVIARGAFGVLYVWGEKSGHCINISTYAARYRKFSSKFTGEKIDFGVQVFFSSLQPGYNDVVGLFQPALDKLGKLSSSEMYGLVPALALGGSMELENLHKLPTIEHLEFLSQLAPLQEWDVAG